MKETLPTMDSSGGSGFRPDSAEQAKTVTPLVSGGVTPLVSGGVTPLVSGGVMSGLFAQVKTAYQDRRYRVLEAVR